VSSPRLSQIFSIALIFVAVSTTYLDYWSYSRTFYLDSANWNTFAIPGRINGPGQYRIGPVLLAHLMTHGHLAMRHAFAIIDLAALLLAMFVLRRVLERSAIWLAAREPLRWFGAASFIVLFQYYLWWLLWYQRPATLPTTMLLALSLLLSTFRLPVAGALGSAPTALAILAVAVLQGFTRPDVGFAFYLGMAIACLISPLGRFALARPLQAALSLAGAAVTGGIQLYLMRVVYPHMTYGNTAIVQIHWNLTLPRRIIPLLLFLAPTLWLVVQIIKKRIRLEAPQTGLLIGSTLFFCLWAALGKFDEVRIFMPFALALTPLMAEAALKTFSRPEEYQGATAMQPE
jgi:hypothetical protein